MLTLGIGSGWVANLGTECQPSLLYLWEKNHFEHPLPVEDLVRPACECSGSKWPLRFRVCSYWFELKGVKAIIVIVPSIEFAATWLKHRLYVYSSSKQGKYLSRRLDL